MKRILPLFSPTYGWQQSGVKKTDYSLIFGTKIPRDTKRRRLRSSNRRNFLLSASDGKVKSRLEFNTLSPGIAQFECEGAIYRKSLYTVAPSRTFYMFLIYKSRNRSLERRYLWYCFVIKFASFERPQDDERVFERLVTGAGGSVWFAERFLSPRDTIRAYGTRRGGAPFLNRFATDSHVRFWTYCNNDDFRIK